MLAERTVPKPSTPTQADAAAVAERVAPPATTEPPCSWSAQEQAAAAYAVANTLLASKGRSFHWARRLLGARHARHATRLYGFCRHVDDLADEADAAADPAAALAGVAADLATGASERPPVADFIALMHACRIEPAVALELLRGVASDLEPARVDDVAQLLRYGYRVAGTVGLMMCRVLDVRAAAAYPHAIDLGIAMQLTNVCRDVAEDARAGRRYLPASLVGGASLAQLADPPRALQPVLRAAIVQLLNLADRYYRSGADGLVYLPLRARLSIRVAAHVYRAIGVRLRARDGDYWSERATVGPLRKVVLTLRALAGTLADRGFWRPIRTHHAALHVALNGLPGVDPIATAPTRGD